MSNTLISFFPPVAKAILSEGADNFLNKISEQVKTTSEKYAPIDSRQLIEDTLKTLKSLGYHNVGVTLRYPGGGARNTTHFITYTIHDLELATDGGLKARIIQRNSYNGEAGFTMRIGFLRLVCTNGLMVGSSCHESYLRHLKGNYFDSVVEGLQPAIAASIKYLRDSASQDVQEMQDRWLTFDQAKLIVADLKLSNRMTKSVELALMKKWLWQTGRVQDRPANLWTLYNIVNEVVRLRSRTQFGSTKHEFNLFDDISRIAAEVAA